MSVGPKRVAAENVREVTTQDSWRAWTGLSSESQEAAVDEIRNSTFAISSDCV